MSRLNLRTAVITVGFVAMSVVVTDTAAGMVGAPSRAPVAAAVQLTQEDPSSRTPVVQADIAATSPVSRTTAPVEVGPPAIQCSEDGVCDGLDEPQRSPHAHDQPRAQQAAPAPVKPGHGHRAKPDHARHGGGWGHGEGHHHKPHHRPGSDKDAHGDQKSPRAPHHKKPRVEQHWQGNHEPPRHEGSHWHQQAGPSHEGWSPPPDGSWHQTDGSHGHSDSEAPQARGHGR